MVCMDLTSALPSEIDALLFPLWAERWTTATHRLQYLTIIERETAQMAKSGREPREHTYSLRVAELDTRLAEIRQEMAPLEAEFTRRGGWTRFDFVPDGHLHYRECWTLHLDTQRLLCAEASGRDEAWIVEHFAYAACTFCFPTAPAEARAEHLKRQKSERDAVRAEKARIKAEKEAIKNLVEPVTIGDGGWPETIRTVYRATEKLKSIVEYSVWMPAKHDAGDQADQEILTEALRRKGIDVDTKIAKWKKAASK